MLLPNITHLLPSNNTKIPIWWWCPHIKQCIPNNTPWTYIIILWAFHLSMHIPNRQPLPLRSSIINNTCTAHPFHNIPTLTLCNSSSKHIPSLHHFNRETQIKIRNSFRCDMRSAICALSISKNLSDRLCLQRTPRMRSGWRRLCSGCARRYRT